MKESYLDYQAVYLLQIRRESLSWMDCLSQPHELLPEDVTEDLLAHLLELSVHPLVQYALTDLY